MKEERFPVNDEQLFCKQVKRINIRDVIKCNGDIGKAVKHNINLMIDRTKRNLPHLDDV